MSAYMAVPKRQHAMKSLFQDYIMTMPIQGKEQTDNFGELLKIKFSSEWTVKNLLSSIPKRVDLWGQECNHCLGLSAFGDTTHLRSCLQRIDAGVSLVRLWGLGKAQVTLEHFENLFFSPASVFLQRCQRIPYNTMAVSMMTLHHRLWPHQTSMQIRCKEQDGCACWSLQELLAGSDAVGPMGANNTVKLMHLQHRTVRSKVTWKVQEAKSQR